MNIRFLYLDKEQKSRNADAFRDFLMYYKWKIWLKNQWFLITFNLKRKGFYFSWPCVWYMIYFLLRYNLIYKWVSVWFLPLVKMHALFSYTCLFVVYKFTCLFVVYKLYRNNWSHAFFMRGFCVTHFLFGGNLYYDYW